MACRAVQAEAMLVWMFRPLLPQSYTGSVRLLFLLSGFVLCVVLVTQRLAVAAVLATGDPFPIEATPGAAAGLPSASTTGDGHFIVVWQEYAASLGPANVIFGKRYDAGGMAVGTAFVINDNNPYARGGAQVEQSQGLGFVVVWQGNYEVVAGTPQRRVATRRFDAAGVPLTGVLLSGSLDPTVLDGDSFVSVAGDGSFLVTWNRTVGGMIHVAGQRYSATGAVQGSEFDLTGADDGASGVTASASDGSFVVGFGRVRFFDFPTQPNFFMGAARFDSSGAAVGTDFPLSVVTEGDQGRWGRDIAIMPNDEYVIVWSDGYYTDVIPRGPYNVFAERRDASGNLIQPAFQVNTRQALEDDGYFGVNMDAEVDGSFVVVWGGRDSSPYYSGGSSLNVLGQRFDAAGLPDGTEFRINTTTAGYPNEPSVASMGDSFLVVWNTTVGLGDFDVTGRTFRVVDTIQCGDLNFDGSVTASDARMVLLAAVSGSFCNVVVCNAFGADLKITATDALRVLQFAVGQSVTLACPDHEI